MAKRGRKKSNKVTSLSSADRSHLSRIMKKVRQIKANKKAAGISTAPSAANLQPLINAVNVAQQAFNNFISRGLDLGNPTNQNTLNQLAQRLNEARQALVNAQLGH